jgi:hypothetical protein
MSSSTLSRILPLKNPTLWKGFALGLGMLVLLLVVAIPNLLRSRMAANHASRSFASSNSYYRMNLAGGSGGDTASMNEALVAIDTVQADGPKIIHKAELELLVANCAETQKKIEALAVSELGFVESSTLEESSAKITLRVPSARFEAVRGKLRDFAIRVRQDSVTAADVSKQYVDRESRLRNLRAEEQQFLEVMKKAHTVPDVLAVTKELSEVRGEIETADAEFRHLKDQIDMAQIDVHLAAQVSSGSHWGLGTSIKSAFSDFLESLATFADFLIWLVVNLPLVVLWGVTIFVLAAACWYVLRKAARLMRAMFGKKATAPDSPQASAKV